MRVVQIWRYPVKSLGGEPLQSARFDLGGLRWDRRYALMDSDPNRSGKPLTARQAISLLGYTATVKDAAVYVRSPDGTECAADDPAWLQALEARLGKPVALRCSDQGFRDDSDVLVITEASLRALGEEYGAFVNPLRFRANIVVDGPGTKPFEERDWIGGDFMAGGAVLRPQAACIRCMIPTIDPETLQADPGFLRLIAQKHDAKFGVYCQVIAAGDVRLGDEWRAAGRTEVTA